MLFILFGLFFAGVTVLAMKQGAHKDSPYVFAIFVVFTVGLLLSGMSVVFIGSDALSMFLLGCTMGSAICLLSGIHIRAALVCDTQVEAVYCGFASYSGGKGMQSHTPIFDYTFEGVTYHQQSIQPCVKRVLEKEMVVGQTVTVYVEPSHPKNVILKRRIGIKNVLMMVFELCCFAIGVMALLA